MRRRKILVFQHVPFEPLGTLDPILRDAGFRIRYVNFGRSPHARPSLDGYAGVIVLGGPMSVHDVADYPNLETEVELLREALDRDMQVLGICLGAQLLARALGAAVGPAPVPEIGWHDIELSDAGSTDEVLGAFAPRQRIFQWHADHCDLPPDAVHLAASANCPTQAFRHGNAYGFQFHLEVDQPLIERWLTTPAHAAELDALADTVHPADIRRETTQRIGATQALASRTFGRWIRRFGVGPRRRLLRSR